MSFDYHPYFKFCVLSITKEKNHKKYGFRSVGQTGDPYCLGEDSLISAQALSLKK